MIEHRLPTRLTDFWERVRKQSPVPSIDKFNPQVIDDLWQKCIMISVYSENNHTIYTYDFIGKDLESVFGTDLVGQKVISRLGFLPARKMMEQMEKSIRNPFPITIEGQFIDATSRVIKYRSCLLPFGTSKENITHFIIGVSWKSF